MTRVAPLPPSARVRPLRTPPFATQQRLDPVGTLGAWPLAPAISLITFAFAVVTTLLQLDRIHTLSLAVAALVAVGAAAIMLMAAARTSRAPFQRHRAVIVISLAVAAYLCEQLSLWGSNQFIQDDFGPISIGLFLVALGPFRPWREIASFAIAAAALVGTLAVLQAPSMVIVVPSVIYGLIAATQVLAPAAAGAAYSRRMVRSILAWQRDAKAASIERARESRGLVEQGIVEERLEALRAGVLPFLADVAERGSIEPADILRARSLSRELRRELLADVDRTWLETLVARERSGLSEQGHLPLLVVADPEARANDFEAEQRVATAALIVALCSLRGFDPGSFVLQISGPDRPAAARRPAATQGGTEAPTTRPTLLASGLRDMPNAVRGPLRITPRARTALGQTVTLQARVNRPERELRAALRPYLGVLRVTFRRVCVTYRHPSFVIEFDAVAPGAAKKTGTPGAAAPIKTLPTTSTLTTQIGPRE